MADFSLKTSLKRLLSAWNGGGPLTLAQALPRLLPKVRPRFQHEALCLTTGKPGPAFQPLAGIFAVSLVVDLPNREVDVGEAELAAWDVDFDRLMQRARSNLLARGGEEGFLQVGPGCYQSAWADNLDGSRLLLPGILQRLQVRGDPVALLPNRDTLLVVGSEDPAGLRWALESALASLHQDPTALNACPLRLSHYHWEPFQALREHPVCPLLIRVERQRLMDEYASQKTLLDRRHGAAGKAITVAPLRLERTGAGEPASYTEWNEAMGEAWLPLADRVRLAWELGGERGRAWVPWARVQGRLSHLLEPVGLFPERYRFKAAPQAGQLEDLLMA